MKTLKLSGRMITVNTKIEGDECLEFEEEPCGWIGYYKNKPGDVYYGFFLAPLQMDSFEEREILLIPVYKQLTAAMTGRKGER